jgi:hypothetical protein
MLTANKSIIDKMFYCERQNVKLLPAACLKMQSYAKDPPRMNPLSSSCFKTDYSKCLDCKQGQSHDCSEIKVTIKKENRGRPIKPHLCKSCGETDKEKFESTQKSMCMACRAIQRKENRHKRRDKINGKK